MNKRALNGLRALIVEDESAIAMLIEDILCDLGCVVVAFAPCLPQALEAVEKLEIDFAVLDVNLAGEKSFPVADLLAAQDIPFLFATGYGPSGIPATYENRPVVAKPFDDEEVRRALLSVVSA